MTFSEEAEEIAVALAILQAEHHGRQDDTRIVITDSHTSCRALSQGLTAPHVHRLLQRLKDTNIPNVRVV